MHSMAHTLVANVVPAAIGTLEPFDASDAHELCTGFYPQLLKEFARALSAPEGNLEYRSGYRSIPGSSPYACCRAFDPKAECPFGYSRCISLRAQRACERGWRALEGRIANELSRWTPGLRGKVRPIITAAIGLGAEEGCDLNVSPAIEAQMAAQ